MRGVRGAPPRRLPRRGTEVGWCTDFFSPRGRCAETSAPRGDLRSREQADEGSPGQRGVTAQELGLGKAS